MITVILVPPEDIPALVTQLKIAFESQADSVRDVASSVIAAQYASRPAPPPEPITPEPENEGGTQ